MAHHHEMKHLHVICVQVFLSAQFPIFTKAGTIGGVSTSLQVNPPQQNLHTCVKVL